MEKLLNLDSIRLLLGNRSAILGLIVIAFVIIVAIFAPYIAPYGPNDQNLLKRLSAPNQEHLLGTDGLGRDILSRIIYGSRISLSVGAISVGVGVLVAIPLGLLAGYGGGLLDDIIMRIVDVMLSFPSILLALVVISILGPGLFNVMIAIGIWSIPLFTRMVRGEVLSTKEEVYIEAARSIGRSKFTIAIRHILPNCFAPIMVLATLRFASAILSAAALSFLGLGAQPPTADWGRMLSQGRQYLRTAWWFSTFPGLAIMFTVLGFNLLGDGLRDSFDPRMR